MYIEQGYKGFHELWRYILGFFSVFVVWQFVGSMPLLVALLMNSGLDSMASGDIGAMSEVLGVNTFLFLMLLTFAIGLVALLFFVKVVHRQSLKSLTTARSKIDWKRVVFSFLLWGIISVIFILIDVYLSPDDYVFNFKPEPFLILFVVAVIMIPIQTSMEEYYMRGYLMQGLGIAAKRKWIPLVITSLLFGSLHLFNPEVEKLGYGIMVFYIGTGLFLGILTLMDDGLELALGFHAANNLITALLVTADWTAFQTDSIYKDISEPVLGWDVLIPVFVIFPLLLFFFSKKYKWSNWNEKLFGKVLSKEEFLTLEESETQLAEHS
ncbi:lysostaphin resistance A-like protein [Flagellimonas sp.]|uniref:CPBP family intramembrane glutamic endopeptidase n=1 Tax=Flagellimonas sp. TaxID=2058762 RepID=UPI003F49E15C